MTSTGHRVTFHVPPVAFPTGRCFRSHFTLSLPARIMWEESLQRFEECESKRSTLPAAREDRVLCGGSRLNASCSPNDAQHDWFCFLVASPPEEHFKRVRAETNTKEAQIKQKHIYRPILIKNVLEGLNGQEVMR